MIRPSRLSLRCGCWRQQWMLRHSSTSATPPSVRSRSRVWRSSPAPLRASRRRWADALGFVCPQYAPWPTSWSWPSPWRLPCSPRSLWPSPRRRPEPRWPHARPGTGSRRRLLRAAGAVKARAVGRAAARRRSRRRRARRSRQRPRRSQGAASWGREATADQGHWIRAAQRGRTGRPVNSTRIASDGSGEMWSCSSASAGRAAIVGETRSRPDLLGNGGPRGCAGAPLTSCPGPRLPATRTGSRARWRRSAHPPKRHQGCRGPPRHRCVSVPARAQRPR